MTERAEQLIAEANVLLDEVKAIHDNEEDMIAKYKEDYCKDRKYYVYYDGCDSKYMTDGLSSMHESLVYFSSEEIAQKCCEWLNSLSE